MDLVYAFEIVTLEHSFYVCELVHPQQRTQEREKDSDGDEKRSIVDDDQPMKMSADFQHAGNNDREQEEGEDPLAIFDNLVPLEELDEDFEAFLAVLEDD